VKFCLKLVFIANLFLLTAIACNNALAIEESERKLTIIVYKSDGTPDRYAYISIYKLEESEEGYSWFSKVYSLTTFESGYAEIKLKPGKYLVAARGGNVEGQEQYWYEKWVIMGTEDKTVEFSQKDALYRIKVKLRGPDSEEVVLTTMSVYRDYGKGVGRYGFGYIDPTKEFKTNLNNFIVSVRAVSKSGEKLVTSYKEISLSKEGLHIIDLTPAKWRKIRVKFEGFDELCILGHCIKSEECNKVSIYFSDNEAFTTVEGKSGFITVLANKRIGDMDYTFLLDSRLEDLMYFSDKLSLQASCVEDFYSYVENRKFTWYDSKSRAFIGSIGFPMCIKDEYGNKVFRVYIWNQGVNTEVSPLLEVYSLEGEHIGCSEEWVPYRSNRYLWYHFSGFHLMESDHILPAGEYYIKFVYDIPNFKKFEYFYPKPIRYAPDRIYIPSEWFMEEQQEEESGSAKETIAKVARGYAEIFNPNTWAYKVLENPSTQYWRKHFKELVYDPLDVLYKITNTEGYKAAATAIKEFITLFDVIYASYIAGVLGEYTIEYPQEEHPYKGFEKLAEMIEKGENIDGKLEEIEIELSNLRNVIKKYRHPLPYPPKAKEDLLHAIDSAEKFIESLKMGKQELTPTSTPLKKTTSKTPGFEVYIAIAALIASVVLKGRGKLI